MSSIKSRTKRALHIRAGLFPTSARRVIAPGRESIVPQIRREFWKRARECSVSIKRPGIPKMARPSRPEIGIRLAQLISRCKSFDLQFHVLPVTRRAPSPKKYSSRCEIPRAQIDERDIRTPAHTYSLFLFFPPFFLPPSLFHSLSRQVTSKKSKFRRKFYRCKYSF